MTLDRTITNGVKKMADDFVLINAKYTPNNGSLFEQYNKTTGEVTSAIALTWCGFIYTPFASC